MSATPSSLAAYQAILGKPRGPSRWPWVAVAAIVGALIAWGMWLYADLMRTAACYEAGGVWGPQGCKPPVIQFELNSRPDFSAPPAPSSSGIAL